MSGDMTEHRRSGPSGPAQHVARLAALVKELEELSRNATEVPPSLLIETRASLERARKALDNCRPSAERAVPEEPAAEVDPQPDVDRDILDRMYRILLKAGRRTPGR
jgi:hypothetical protein